MTNADETNIEMNKELNSDLHFEINLSKKNYAEKWLLNALALAEKNAETEGWLTIEESRKRLGI